MEIVPITQYELVRILGERATQISSGARIMTEIGNLVDPLKIAEKEFREGVIPLNIIRTMPNGQKIRINIKPPKA